MPYRVRCADVLETRDQVLPIWAANLHVRSALDEKLRWFYTDSPHGQGQTFLIEPTAAHGAVIGTAGLGMRSVWYRSQRLRSALFADLAIDRAHRSGFPALALLRAVKQHVTTSFDLGYGLPNAKAAPIFRRAGYRELGVRARYARVLRSGAHLQRRIDNALVARALGKVVDRGLLLVSRVRTLGDRDKLELSWPGEFDARFDRLWDEARQLAPILGDRSSASLRWRFSMHPERCYRLAALTEAATGRLRAYAVLRDVGGVAELSDLFGAGERELDALLARLVPTLYERGFQSMTFEFLGAPWLHELLAFHAFRRRPELRPVALVVGDGHKSLNELADSACWYLTDFDEDT